MADFMREQFYAPILAAARKRFTSLAFGGAGDRPVELHNLLGDAAAFAGSVSNLLALAQDLQAVGRAYEDRLRRAAPGLTDESAAEALEAELLASETETATRLEALRLDLDRTRTQSAEAPALALEEKMRRLDQIFARRYAELERLRAETRARLEAGDDKGALEAYLERLAAWETDLEKKAKQTRDALARMSAGDRDARLTELLERHFAGRARATEEEMARLRQAQETRQRAVEEQRRAATGFGLETGTYISYGASAEVITLDDEVFGKLRVAISEKINEAARGTARSAQIKARLDADIEEARRSRKQPALTWPFRVYVDSAYGLMLPNALSRRLESAVREKDVAEGKVVTTRLGELALADLERLAGGEAGTGTVLQTFSDIHNLGVALSEAALEAYLGETLASRLHFAQTVPVSGLAPEIAERFLFRDATLSFVVSVPAAADEADPTAGALVFRHAGDVQFRGFELKGATGVYELVGLDRGFGKLLGAHHLAEWIDEARDDPGRLITDLGGGS